MASILKPVQASGRTCKPGFFRPLAGTVRAPVRRSTTQNTPSPNPTPDPTQTLNEDGEYDSKGKKKRMNWGPTLFKMFESAATTFASIAILGYVLRCRCLKDLDYSVVTTLKLATCNVR